MKLRRRIKKVKEAVTGPKVVTEYYCHTCKKPFEASPPAGKCPTCGHKNYSRELISPTIPRGEIHFEPTYMDAVAQRKKLARLKKRMKSRRKRKRYYKMAS